MVRVTFDIGSVEIMTDKYKISGRTRFEIRSKENPEVFGLITKEERNKPESEKFQNRHAYTNSNGYGKADQIQIDKNKPAFFDNVYREANIDYPLFKKDGIFAYYIVDKELKVANDTTKMKRYIVYQVIGDAWYTFRINVPPTEDEKKYLEDYWTMFNTFRPEHY
jgi:hypothetical protein